MSFRIRPWHNREVKQTKSIRYKQAALQWGTSWNKPEYKVVHDLCKKECNPGRLRVGVLTERPLGIFVSKSARRRHLLGRMGDMWRGARREAPAVVTLVGGNPVSDEGEDGPEAAHLHSRHLVP